MIEAHWLFGVGGDQIDVVITPHVGRHSMSRWTDGRSSRSSAHRHAVPISTAFSIPGARAGPAAIARPGKGPARLRRAGYGRVSLLRLAYRALDASAGGLPVVLNAPTNRGGAVSGRQAWVHGHRGVIEQTMGGASARPGGTLASVRAVDVWARDSREIARG